MLEVDVRHRRGAFTLAARFASGPGLTALFGRSGAGKSTLIDVIAGLIRPDAGRIVVGDTVLLDTAQRVFIPPHRRRLGYVFQEGRLFPHLTVRQNLNFGRWFNRRAKAEASLDDIVALLGIGHLLGRRPAGLSGGEKQRVALGRALIASPRLLLMDEPLSALDAERKEEILPFIERLRDQSGIPIVYVSHSVAEVTRLATNVVLMSEGGVAATGSIGEIMSRVDLAPDAGWFEAGAVLETRVAGHDARYHLTRLSCPAGDIEIPQITLPVGAPVRLRIRAREVILATDRPHGLSARNLLQGRIAALGAERGGSRDLRIETPGGSLLARVTERSLVELGLVPGREVFALVKSVAIDRQGLGGIVGIAEEDA